MDKRHRHSSDVVGQKFGRLTITEYLGVVNKDTRVMAVCECGVVKSYVYGSFLRSKNATKSCGCLNKEQFPLINIKHNLAEHPLHYIWCGMLNRCYNKEDRVYHNYGGKGVTVCDEWRKDFMSFYTWAISNGWRKGLILDKDKFAVNKNGYCYSPEFCSFITRRENAWYRVDSKKVTYKGEEKCLAEWCEILKLNYPAVIGRLNRGMSPEKAFNTPIRNSVISIEYNGRTETFPKWCEILQISGDTLYGRLNSGWSVQKAFETPIKNRASKILI